jgi:hypothetical protein
MTIGITANVSRSPVARSRKTTSIPALSVTTVSRYLATPHDHVSKSFKAGKTRSKVYLSSLKKKRHWRTSSIKPPSSATSLVA